MKSKIIFLFFIFSFSVFAEESRFSQKIQWKKDPNAIEYRIDIKDENDMTVMTSTVENSYVVVSLPSGSYKYKVISYDFLGREASSTGWKTFKILKAIQPQVEMKLDSLQMKREDKKNINLPVDIKSITRDSKVFLINEKTGEEVSGLVTYKDSKGDEATNVFFPSVRPGVYRIRVVNPGGLSSVSDVINVEAPPPRVFDNDMHFLAGASYIYGFDQGLFQYSDKKFIPGVKASLYCLPIKNQYSRFGFSLDGYISHINQTKDYYSIDIPFCTTNLNLLYKLSLNPKTSLIYKAGGGVFLLRNDITYDSSKVSMVSDLKSTYKGYFSCDAGMGAIYCPVKFIAFELGVDFVDVFINNLNTYFLTPYVCLGLKW